MLVNLGAFPSPVKYFVLASTTAQYPSDRSDDGVRQFFIDSAPLTFSGGETYVPKIFPIPNRKESYPMMKRWRAVVAAAAVVVLTMSAIAMAAKGGKTVKKDVIWPADAIKWEAGPVKGTHVAKLWGDWMKGGPYGVLVKFDAGLMNPLHKHTQTLKIVVVSGTFVHQPEGSVETKLGPGSYLVQVAGKNHVSGCLAGAECEFFMTSADKFDLIPVGAPPAQKKQ